MKFRFVTTILFSLTILLTVSASGFSTGKRMNETRTKVRIEPDGVWLESEISPQALSAVLPYADTNHDGRLDEAELSASRDSILAYYSRCVNLESDGRHLQADSVYFAFRSPARPAAVPDRLYIYHWFATLRRPQSMKLANLLFCELPDGCDHRGLLISGKQIIEFAFPRAGTTHAMSVSDGDNAIEFSFSRNGEVSIVKPDSNIARAGYVWLGVGLGGLLLLRVAAAARIRLNRKSTAKSRRRVPVAPVEKSSVLT